VRRILSNGLTRAVAYQLVCSYAKLELLGGVTTIRTVGGLADFDTPLPGRRGKGEDPGSPHPCRQRGYFGARRHMAGSVAVAGPQQCRSAGPAPQGRERGGDLVKLMIDGRRAGSPNPKRANPRRTTYEGSSNGPLRRYVRVPGGPFVRR